MTTTTANGRFANAKKGPMPAAMRKVLEAKLASLPDTHHLRPIAEATLASDDELHRIAGTKPTPTDVSAHGSTPDVMRAIGDLHKAADVHQRSTVALDAAATATSEVIKLRAELQEVKAHLAAIDASLDALPRIVADRVTHELQTLPELVVNSVRNLLNN